MDKDALDMLSRLAAGIARTFGRNCEVVVHDLTSANLQSTVVAIENGHVSDRKLGDGPSHAALDALRRGNSEDQLDYLSKTADGRVLKSSTIYIKDKAGRPTGIFAINYDITDLVYAKNAIETIVAADNRGKEPERITQNVNELLDDLIEQSVKSVGKPVALMTKDDKIAAIRFLNDAGAFLITKSGDRITKYFGISKYTLYNYLDLAQ